MVDIAASGMIDVAGDATGGEVRLGDAGVGARGTVVAVRTEGRAHGVSADELLRRLLEFGFVEGAQVEVLHEGALGRDPIAVKVDDMRVALRRRDAACVMIRPAA
jgi:ferrous iron transport protein A